jgi:hypothetical protein
VAPQPEQREGVPRDERAHRAPALASDRHEQGLQRVRGEVLKAWHPEPPRITTGARLARAL